MCGTDGEREALEISLPFFQPGPEISHETVLLFAAQLMEQVFVQFTRALETGGVCGFALEDGDLLEAGGFG